MKVSLVVAAGAHEGRVIPITGPQFLIGRDAQCHLRPASPAISKLHCAILVRDGTVLIKDFGSTNGTLVNDKLIQNVEVSVQDGAMLRVGPLDFRIKIEQVALKPDSTPLPEKFAESAAALAAVKAAGGSSKAGQDATPNPARQPGKQGGSKESPAVKPAPGARAPISTTSESVSDEDQDRIAAMLLGMDDDGNSSVPDGSTVMDIPSPLLDQTTIPGEKKEEGAKPAQTREEMSNVANELLRKYMRRPK